MSDELFVVTWHGMGLFCVAVLYLLIKRLVSMLRGCRRLKIFFVISGGLAGGIAGLVLWFLYMFSSYSNWMDFVSLNERYFLVVAIDYFSTVICGAVIASLARKHCPPRGILYVALCFTTLVVLQPIAYNWLKRLGGFWGV